MIRELQVRSEAAPTPYCAEGNANYDALLGLKIGAGFTKRVRALVGGSKAARTSPNCSARPLPPPCRPGWPWRASAAASGPCSPSQVRCPATCQAYRSGCKALDAIWPVDRRA